MIDRNSRARIADFGLLTVISDQANFISSIPHSEGGTTQWMSPELLDPGCFDLKDSRPTKKSDIYALGMVVYEVLSGQAPFPRCNDAVVIRKVMGGERPKRPQGKQGARFEDDLWDMLALCWKPQRGDRPSLKALLRCLERVPPRPRSSSPTSTTNEDMEMGADDLSDHTITDLSTFFIPFKPSG